MSEMELKPCPETVMDNNGDTWPIPELADCPCGGVAKIGFVGNAHHKKQVVKIYCTAVGCHFEQRVGTLWSRHTIGWAIKKCAERWNSRPTEDALRTENERLKLELADALDVQYGNGPTALEMLFDDRNALRKRVEELEGFMQRIVQAEDVDDLLDIREELITPPAAKEGE